MSAEFENLNAEDRAAIVAEFDRLVAQPAPVNTSTVGCALFLLAGLLFIVGPLVWRRVPVLTVPFFVAEGILVLFGLFWYFRGSGGGFARAADATKLAEATLKMTSATAAERRNAAVCLVAQAYYSDGPSMSTTFNFDDARQQLGEVMPFVIAVEKFLIAERKASPVFTLAADNGEPPLQA